MPAFQQNERTPQVCDRAEIKAYHRTEQKSFRKLVAVVDVRRFIVGVVG